MVRALVLGAGGQVGRAAVAELVAAGWEVDAQSRHAPADVQGLGARPVAGTRAELVRAAGGYEAVVDPLAFTAADAGEWLALAEDIGALAVISTASVYADAQGRGFESEEFPHYPPLIGEDQPRVAPGPGYSAEKVALEQAFDGAPLPVALLRPGAIHGIGARHPREFWAVKRLLDGRRRIALRHPGTVFHTTSTRGLARLTRLCLEARFSGPVNAGDADLPSVRALVQAVAGAMGREVALWEPGTDAPDHVGASPWSAPRPIVMDLSRARGLGFDPTRHGDDLGPYLDWMIAGAADWRQKFPVFAGYGHDPFDYAAEDAALP